MALNPDDLLLFNRGDKLYKTEYSQLIQGLEGGPPVFISADAPDTPASGDLWWADTDIEDGGGRLYIWTGTEWVDVSQPFGGGGGGPATLAVGKGQITPKVDVDPGDTLTGNAIVYNASNPVETHVWELDGSEDQRGTNDTYTAKPGVIRYRKEVTDDNGTAIGAWSDPLTVEDSSSPTATMSGLRFDRSRRTKLKRSLSGLTSFTASVWYKCTKLQDFNNILTLPGVSDPAVIRCKADGSVAVAIGGTEQVSTTGLQANVWTHIVVTAESNGNATISVNGSTPTSGSGVPNLSGAVRVEISGNNNSVNQELDGYLSDVYFVEKVLEPTAFGQSFEGKWGPLEGSKVIANVNGFGDNGFYLPFDPAKAGKNYSSGSTLSGDLNPSFDDVTALFNGSLGTDGRVQSTSTNNAAIQWKPATEISGAVEIFLRNGDTSNTTISYSLDGGSNWTPVPTTGGNGSWVSIGTSATVSTANGISVRHTTTAGTNFVDWRGIKHNDVVLVDHSSIGVDASGNDNHFYDENFGVGNADHIWSNLLSTDTSFNGPKTDGFNGSLTGSSAYTANPGSYIEVDLTGKFSGSRTFDVYISTGANSFTVTYTDGNGTTPLNDVVGSTTFVANNITTIRITGTSSGAELYGIVVDGDKLIDPSFVDTVLDTPMNNYAVLESGFNGNLSGDRSTGTSLSTISSNDKFYFEASVVKKGTTNPNFMSFGVANGTTHVASFSGGGDTYRDGAQFGGVQADLVWDIGDVFGLAWSSTDKKLDIYKNGSLVFTIDNVTSDGPFYARLGHNPSSDHIGSINFGQQPFVYTPPAGYEGLYQEWSQWARTPLGFALDRIAKLESFIQNIVSRLTTLEGN